MPSPILQPIIHECIDFSKEYAIDFGCSCVKWDYTYESPRLAMCFKCKVKKKRDEFIARVMSRNRLFFVFLMPDPDPELRFPDPSKAEHRWRVVFEIDPNHPFFRGLPLPS